MLFKGRGVTVDQNAWSIYFFRFARILAHNLKTYSSDLNISCFCVEEEIYLCAKNVILQRYSRSREPHGFLVFLGHKANSH